MRLINADILGELKSPVKEDVGDYGVREFRKGWNMAIETIMENAPTEPVIDHILKIIDGCKFSYKEREVSAWDGIEWHNKALGMAEQAIIDKLKGGERK